MQIFSLAPEGGGVRKGPCDMTDTGSLALGVGVKEAEEGRKCSLWTRSFSSHLNPPFCATNGSRTAEDRLGFVLICHI